MDKQWEQLIKVMLRLELICLFIPQEFDYVKSRFESVRQSLLFSPPENGQIFIEKAIGIFDEVLTNDETKEEPWVPTILTIWTNKLYTTNPELDQGS